MTNTRIMIRIALLVALAATAHLGCARRGTPDGSRRPAPDTGSGREVTAMAVSTYRVGATDEGNALILPGRIAAREEVTITATIAGRLTAFPYAEGQRFPEGAPIAIFGTPETRAALNAARTTLDAASLRLDLARIQEARLDSLYAQRVAALRELELAREERLGAEAARNQAQAADAALRAGAGIRAPFAGVVVRRRADPGTSVGPGGPLLDIRSIGAGEIVAAVPEGIVPDLREAGASFQTGDGAWRPALLLRVDGMTDFTTRTRTARFRPAEKGVRLEAGSFARVRIESRQGSPSAAAPASLSVPIASVVRRGGLTGVYVLREGHATLRWIRLGRVDGMGAEVLAGLSPGEEIALNPTGLADGQAVTARR
jgi:RND family efflux transporter MFP subunit